jgi:hypothetical protein
VGVFRQVVEQCDRLLQPHLGESLIEVMYGEGADGERLKQTGYAQAAIFVVEYALSELWKSLGIVPDVVSGHSIGEYVDACVAGVLSLEDALAMVAARGKGMQELPAGGAMAAVFASEAEAAPWIARAGVSLAAVNAEREIVISGEEEAVEKLRSELTARGVETQRLQVSHTFHSPLMEPMLAGFEKVASAVRYQTAQVEMVSKVIEELLQPRSSSQGHTLETPWSDLQLAYFAGCAMWTYLNTPFLLVRRGVESEELEPWQEAGETWRRLRVRFPADIATHSTEQTLYFRSAGIAEEARLRCRDQRRYTGRTLRLRSQRVFWHHVSDEEKDLPSPTGRPVCA